MEIKYSGIAVPDGCDLFKDKTGRGNLFVLSQVPFEVRRLFFIKDVPDGTTRGEHAHRSQKQFFICVKGKIVVNTRYRGTSEQVMIFPGDVIYVDRMVWSDQVYFDDAILLVLCDGEYDEKDYIRDEDEFNRLTQEL